MKKILLLSLFLLSVLLNEAMAQSKTITGRVTDAGTGEGMPGVTVQLKGTSNAAPTDVNGNYSISVPTTGGTLVFSFIGYTSQEVAIGNQTTINARLATDARQLNEVVVTALGIERQKKEVGYAATTVTDEVVTRANPVNVANGLQGKVSGMNISSVNNGVFENVKINLRGIRSLTGNNNPLLLLDGVPADINYLSSINPNDIDNVTVLKGASGAAIYGPDARNGVIIVQTKRGSLDEKPTVTVSHSTQLSQISFFPKLQKQFGSGAPGEYIPYENWSWGPAFDGTMRQTGRTLEDGSIEEVRYSATNEREDFFETGVTTQNDVSLAAKDFYLSFQDAKITGIVPDDENRRTGLRLNASKEYGKLRLGLNTNYIQQNYEVFHDQGMSDFFIGLGVGGNNGLMDQIFNTPAQIPISKYKNINAPFADYNTWFNDYGLNPYFAIDNWRNEGKREDLLSNLDLNFKATEWLTLNYRAGLTSRFINERFLSKGETPNQFGLDRAKDIIPGSITERSYRSTRLSSEAFASLNYQINDDFKVDAVAGTYVRQTEARDTRVGAANLVVPELFTVTNRTGELSGSSPYAKSRLFSLYGSVGVHFREWAHVELTGRNDKTSVLSANNNSFFYPGVSASLVLSDAIPALQDNSTISYLKLRGSWNQTGNADIDPYQLAPTFSQAAGFPYGDMPGFSASNTTYDAELKPEFIESKEIGVETGFLDGRINVEATYFHQDMDDQIIPVAVSSATGYTNAYVNAASFVNKGLELDLRLTPLVELGDFNVEFRANATYLDSEIKSIYEGLDEIFIGGYTTGTANFAVVGQPAFTVKATDYNRDEQGRVIVDRYTGLPTQNSIRQNFGRSLPKWIVGLNPSVNWKGFNLSALFEYKGGHVAYHGIGADMAWTGVSVATARNNRERFVFPNSVYENPENPGTYVPNTSVTINNVNAYYTGVFQDVGSNFISSADHWRFRELALSFEIPTSFLDRLKIVKGASVSLTGRNLFLWVPETNEFQDPDFNFASTGNTSGINTSQINPPTRTFGGSVTLRF